ncbi:hypothetical protein BLOT_002198 [Blomia tropicalis]|nr:hypothetical protein BLOT_002198 [Blomia tropicalis]
MVNQIRVHTPICPRHIVVFKFIASLPRHIRDLRLQYRSIFEKTCNDNIDWLVRWLVGWLASSMVASTIIINLLSNSLRPCGSNSEWVHLMIPPVDHPKANNNSYDRDYHPRSTCEPITTLEVAAY